MVSGLKSHAATEHPAAASWMTSSRPMPEPPPVTTASFPVNESITITSDRDAADSGEAAGQQDRDQGGERPGEPGRAQRDEEAADARPRVHLAGDDHAASHHDDLGGAE